MTIGLLVIYEVRSGQNVYGNCANVRQSEVLSDLCAKFMPTVPLQLEQGCIFAIIVCVFITFAVLFVRYGWINYALREH